MASIQKETRGNSTRYRVRHKYADGTWAPSKSFPRRSDATVYKAHLEAGLLVERARKAAPTTVGDVLDQFMTTRRAGRSTLSKERSLAKRLTPLADHEVAALRASHVRAWVADLVDDGLAAETVSALLRLLRQVLDQAVDDEYAVANVAARVKPPKITHPQLDAEDVLDLDEARRVVAAVDSRYRALFALRVFAGPRLSEALGLRREDVDFMRRRVHVGHRVLEEVDGVAVLRQGGKTGRGSDRWVPLPDEVVVLLGEHLRTYPPGQHGLIFTVADGSPVLRDNLRQRVWDKAVKASGVRPITMRNLRHTAVTLMMQAEVPILDICQRTGHAKPSTMLDVYARWLPARDTEDVFAAYLRA